MNYVVLYSVTVVVDIWNVEKYFWSNPSKRTDCPVFFVPPCGREHLYFGVFGLNNSLFSCFDFVLVLLPLSETWSDAVGCYGDSVQYHVFEMSRPLPRFSMYSLLDIDHAIPEPQSHMTFHVKERVNRVSCFRLPFRLTAPCGLWGCKNKPAPFRGRMS